MFSPPGVKVQTQYIFWTGVVSLKLIRICNEGIQPLVKPGIPP